MQRLLNMECACEACSKTIIRLSCTTKRVMCRVCWGYSKSLQWSLSASTGSVAVPLAPALCTGYQHAMTGRELRVGRAIPNPTTLLAYCVSFSFVRYSNCKVASPSWNIYIFLLFLRYPRWDTPLPPCTRIRTRARRVTEGQLPVDTGGSYDCRWCLDRYEMPSWRRGWIACRGDC
jgi:hypothetical protein